MYWTRSTYPIDGELNQNIFLVLSKMLIVLIKTGFSSFIDNYRLPKSIVHQLIEDIKFFVPDTANTLSIPLHLQVLASLNFYASGSHQLRVGLDAFARMSQSKISTSLARISDVIATKLGSRYVYFPLTLDAANAKKEEFLNKYGVPGIVGLIDCTHIALADIKRQYEYSYVNRKNYHSINTQAVITKLNYYVHIIYM